MARQLFNRKQKTKVAGFFPITQHRFDTKQHPALLMPGRAQEKFTLSGQELQMLHGLVNILETNDVGAIRIALWEAMQARPESLERYVFKAKAGATTRGHMNRNHRASVQLPKQLKGQLYDGSFPISGLTPGEQIRLALIWLAKGIRDERITKLTNSKKRSQEELAMAWSQANKDRPKGSKLTALKEAHAQAVAKTEAEFQEHLKALDEEASYLIHRSVADGVFSCLWDQDASDRENFDTLRAHYYDGPSGDDELTEDNLEDYIDSLIAAGLDEAEARSSALEDLETAKAAAAEADDLEPDWALVSEMERLGWSFYDATVRVETGLPLEPPSQGYIDEITASTAVASERLKRLTDGIDLSPIYQECFVASNG